MDRTSTVLTAHVFEDTRKDKGFPFIIIILRPVRAIEGLPHQLIDRGRDAAQKDEEQVKRDLGTRET
jgi:hypothetical protein